MDVNHSPFLDAEPHHLASQMYYTDLSMDMDMPVDMSGFGDMASLHVDPAHMHIDPDASLTGNSPTTSWTFTPPQSPPGYYTGSPLSELDTSPSDYGHLASDSGSHAYAMSSQQMTTGDLSATIVPDDGYPVPQSLNSRRSRNEGESARDARDHALYRNATPKSDGLFHCPWEGKQECHHKPEKLKCNYE
jgi:hypothetical protein